MSSPVFTEYQGRRFVCFSSPHADNGELSNWHETRFSLDSRTFDTSEQAFLYLKAMTSGDEATALRVFAMSDPTYFARLSKQIRPFDARSWAGRRESVMRQCVREKFSQDEKAKSLLLATGDATIVCCSRNPLWGCGFEITQTERLEPSKWPGQNLLGTILMDTRAALRPPATEPAPQTEAKPETEPEGTDDADDAPSAALTQPMPALDGATQLMPAASPEDGAEAPEPEVSPSEPSGNSDTPDASDAPEEPKMRDEGNARSEGSPEEESAGAEEPGSTSELPPVDERSATTVTAPTAVEDQPSAGAPEADGAPASPHVSASPAEEEPSDPIVSRYAQGHAPTTRELSDGSVLKHLMRTFTQNDSLEVRQALMQCLRDSTVTVPAQRVDPVVAAIAPVRDDGTTDPLVMDNGSTYRPSILENDSGERWFPTFSSPAEVDEQVARQVTLLQLPMAQCVEMARTRGGLSGIVVNVFSENLILPGRTCDYIAGLPATTE